MSLEQFQLVIQNFKQQTLLGGGKVPRLTLTEYRRIKREQGTLAADMALDIQTMMNAVHENGQGQPKAASGAPLRNWKAIWGLVFLAFAVALFSSLLVASLFGREVPRDSRYLVVAIFSLVVGASIAFLGGSMRTKGEIPIPWTGKSLSFSATGGVAATIAVAVLGYWLYVPSGHPDGSRVNPPQGYQAYHTTSLGFGFAYPRAGWELDQSGMAERFGDLSVRCSQVRSAQLQFRVSLIPPDYTGKRNEYLLRIIIVLSRIRPRRHAKSPAFSE